MKHFLFMVVMVVMVAGLFSVRADDLQIQTVSITKADQIAPNPGGTSLSHRVYTEVSTADLDKVVARMKADAIIVPPTTGRDHPDWSWLRIMLHTSN